MVLDAEGDGGLVGRKVTFELHHGDCLELMPILADKSIDLVLTDPPYGTTAMQVGFGYTV
jgi:DNA modification methylase